MVKIMHVPIPATGIATLTADAQLRKVPSRLRLLAFAKQANLILVNTVDLFSVVLKLKNRPNDDFARRCRQALRASEGRAVVFPSA
jgi:hypothetical protein